MFEVYYWNCFLSNKNAPNTSNPGLDLDRELVNHRELHCQFFLDDWFQIYNFRSTF